MVHRVEIDDEKVRALLEEDRIGNLGIAGDLEQAEEHPPEVWLDDPDEPAGVMTVSWWVRIYARDREALDRLLPHLPERHKFEESHGLMFGGVAAWIRDAVAEAMEITWENPCWLYHLEPADHDPARIRHEIRPLGKEHAELANRHWPHADEVDYVRWMIARGPTAAIFEDGEPVSWALVHSDNQMGLMHTVEEARGRGLALSVTAALAGEILGRGRVPFFYTVKDNLPAQGLAEKSGFRRWGEYSYFGAKPRLSTV